MVAMIVVDCWRKIERCVFKIGCGLWVAVVVGGFLHGGCGNSGHFGLLVEWWFPGGLLGEQWWFNYFFMGCW